MRAEERRILAIDYGAVRVGLAISDPLGLFATGIGTLPNDTTLTGALKKIIDERHVARIIVGMPLTLKGEAGESAKEVEAFIAKLREATPIEIFAVDERFTSVLAADTIRSLGVGKKKREKEKGKIDEIAAVHLLQGYLQSRAGGF